MPQLKRIGILALIAAGIMVLATGCGKSDSTFNPDTGQHQANWMPLGHRDAAQGDQSACTECHGTDFAGGISGVSCLTCHIDVVNGRVGCSECHGYPPTTPAHPAHLALGSIACGACHANTVGTASHDNGTVDVNIAATYNAKSGAASFSSGAVTCSNVSCHGGQTTPTWPSGSIDVNTQCTSCHASGSTQYNSYYSGRHTLHVNSVGVACYVCHSTAKLQPIHFTHLDTNGFDVPPAQTIADQLQYNGSSCNPSQGGLSGCHGSHTW